MSIDENNDKNDIINPENSPEKPQIEMEVFENAFDQDESPLINTAPIQIITEDDYTTVVRESACTLYNGHNEVVDTISIKYLANYANDGEDATALISNDDDGSDYLLISKMHKECPILKNTHTFDKYDDNVKIGNTQLTRDKATFLINYNVLESYGNSGYTVPTNVKGKWQAAIEKGLIRFVNTENAKKISPPSYPPNLQKTNTEIQHKISNSKNLTHFPQKKSLFFRIQNEPKKDFLSLLNWTNELPINWPIKEFTLPDEINKIEDLKALGIDPRDNFLLVGSENNLYVLDHHKKPMEIVYKMENLPIEPSGAITLKEDGSILVGDKEGNLTMINTNLNTFPSHEEKKEQKRVLQRLNRLKGRKKIENNNKNTEGNTPTMLPEIQKITDEIINDFSEDIEKAATLDDIKTIETELKKLENEYQETLKSAKIAADILKPVFDLLEPKKSEILSSEIGEQMAEIHALFGRIDGMSLPALADSKGQIERTKAIIMGSNVDRKTKTEISQISDAFAEKTAEILGQDEEKLLIQIDSLFSDTKTQLENISKLSDFEIWKSTDYPAFLDAITNQFQIIPASHQKVIEKLRKIESVMRKLKTKYSEKFKEQYETVREEAVKQVEILAQTASERIDEFLESFDNEVQKKSFKTKDDATQWAERNSLYSAALGMIESLKVQNPEKADELSKNLKVETARLTYEVKRSKDATVEGSTGRQIAMFGETAFPVWEHKVEAKNGSKIELTYKVDNSTKGAGVKPEDNMCELFYKITDKNGKVKTIPMHTDDDRRYGLDNDKYYKNGSYFSSYIKVSEAKKIKSAIRQMESKNPNDLKEQYKNFRNKITELNQQIADMKKENGGDWDELKEKRTELTKEYITFLQESGVYGLSPLKSFRKKHQNGEAVENSAGQGLVPDWASDWVVDKATEKSLQSFAEMAKMTLGLKEGIISLEGHAGTGKDVLLQMFANKTKRPLYSFDGSKWTTEFDLSQDVSLAAEDGASFTVKEDSAVVKALETPGAILYFNEFNAMPEQAQIFLHSLFDSKRQITLKTSGGRVVKADPAVIICSSMNPNYPGTNHPQFATRSRMIPLQIGFPEFKTADGNFSSAEALRIARSVKSLEDLTYDPDMEENEFVNLWNEYINHDNTNDNLTPDRKFDIEVIFALITFANKLREGFINKITKNGGRQSFKTSQPCTMRELRRCAYVLSSMDSDEKQDPSKAESVAKNLLRRFYSPYIFDEKEAKTLETNLSMWTVQKPVSSTI